MIFAFYCNPKITYIAVPGRPPCTPRQMSATSIFSSSTRTPNEKSPNCWYNCLRTEYDISVSVGELETSGLLEFFGNRAQENVFAGTEAAAAAGQGALNVRYIRYIKRSRKATGHLKEKN